MDLIDVSTRVEWPVYVGLGLVAGWMVWVLIAPDYWWRLERSLVGWQYRDGHRIELSAAGRLWVRFWAVVTLVIVCVVGGATVGWTAESRVRTEQWPSGGTVYDVGDPVKSPGCTVRVFACLRSDVVFPIPVTKYEALDDRPAGLDALPNDTNLVLYVASRFLPTRVVLVEGEQVTVTLYGKCAPRPFKDPYGRSTSDCDDTAGALFDRGVVPVSLREPLGGRALIDGHRATPVEPAS